MSLLDTDTSSLPAWVEQAIDLLQPVLKVMARPVVVNNLRRVAADPSHPTQQELQVFLERVVHGVSTFGSRERAEEAVRPLRRLLHA